MVVKSSHIFFVYIGIPADGYPSPIGGTKYARRWLSFSGRVTKYARGCISDKGKNGVIDIERYSRVLLLLLKQL